MQVKSSLSTVKYLDIKDFKLRQAMARLRTSAHNLTMDGWMNQAYSRLSTTHGHITDCKL